MRFSIQSKRTVYGAWRLRTAGPAGFPLFGRISSGAHKLSLAPLMRVIERIARNLDSEVRFGPEMAERALPGLPRRRRAGHNPEDFSRKSHAILPSPMNRTVKTFVVWMLMLMLPLHAVAASVGMSCAPVRQHEMAGVGMAHHQPAAKAQAHPDGCHAPHKAAAATHDDAPVSDLAKKAHSSCSACSALCAGAVAPPSVFLPLPTFDGSDAVNASPSAFAAGFIPDGPQRPPRYSFA